jgi:hypothetical protein
VGNGEEISRARIKIYGIKEEVCWHISIYENPQKLTSAFRINFKETF